MSPAEFDRYASEYRAVVNAAVRVSGLDVDRWAGYKARLLLNLMNEQLGDSRALKVLDVGCGIGLVDCGLVSGVGELHGVDTSQGSLEAATRLVPAARFTHFDGLRIPYPDSSFDFVFAICVLHHVTPSDRVAFVGEMTRVARPGGVVLVLEHNPLNPVTRYMVSAVLLTRTQYCSDVRQPDSSWHRPACGQGARPISPSGPGDRHPSNGWSDGSAGYRRVPSTMRGRRRRAVSGRSFQAFDRREHPGIPGAARPGLTEVPKVRAAPSGPSPLRILDPSGRMAGGCWADPEGSASPTGDVTATRVTHRSPS